MVTLYLLTVIFNFADGLLGHFINGYLLQVYGYEIPGLGLAMTLVLIFGAGFLSTRFFGQWLFRNFEEWFGRLPLIRRIYHPVKQLTGFLFAKEGQEPTFRQVVLVQYPRPGCYSLGLVTNESAGSANMVTGPLLTLLVPTAPSPLTGPIVFVPKSDVIPLDMTIEEAFKLVISGGVVGRALRAAKSAEGSVA